MSAPHINLYPLCYLCAKNYESWLTFHELSGPSSSLYYLGHFKNPGLID